MTVLSEESDIIYKYQKKNCSEMISHFTAVLIICSFDQEDQCSHFFVRSLLISCMGCDISINIDGCYISIFASALSSAFRSLFLDQKLLDAEADLVVGFVEVNDLSCDFLADLEYIAQGFSSGNFRDRAILVPWISLTRTRRF